MINVGYKDKIFCGNSVSILQYFGKFNSYVNTSLKNYRSIVMTHPNILKCSISSINKASVLYS